MSVAITGENVVFYIYRTDQYVPVVCATGCSLTKTTELVPKTTFSSAVDREYRPRRNSYEISLEGISTITQSTGYQVQELMEDSIRQAGVNWRMVMTDSDNGNTIIFSGFGFIESNTINGDVSSFSDYSCRIIGSGTLEIDSDITPNDPELETESFEAIGGETSYQDANVATRDVAWVMRESSGVITVPITAGSPIGKEVKYTKSTGTFTFPTDNPLAVGEIFIYTFIN